MALSPTALDSGACISPPTAATAVAQLLQLGAPFSLSDCESKNKIPDSKIQGTFYFDILFYFIFLIEACGLQGEGLVMIRKFNYRFLLFNRFSFSIFVGLGERRRNAMAAVAMLRMCRCLLSLAGSLLISVASVSSPSRLRAPTEIWELKMAAKRWLKMSAVKGLIWG